MKKSMNGLFRLAPLIFAILTSAMLSGYAIGAPVSTIVNASRAFRALLKVDRVLPDEAIVRLSNLSGEINGTVKVGRELGDLRLSNAALEDAFMRIAIYQGKIERTESEDMFRRLTGTPGFRTTLRKITGNNQNGTAGHLNELRIANAAANDGFEVLAIGDTFSDGLKRAPTDIDILLRKGNRVVAIEAKNYLSSTALPMDSFRADLNTLMVYKKYKSGSDDVLTVFSLSRKPNDPNYERLLELEAGRRGVQLVIGSPVEVINQVNELLRII